MAEESRRYVELGNFLKARRARLSPAAVGLPPGHQRRTPGLRREEVAQLAGIGLTWYTWLEQGRPIQVSSYVLECLSRVFYLNQDERLHLYVLARLLPPAHRLETAKAVSPALQNVLDTLKQCPSMITDDYWNVVAWNKEACLVFGDFSAMSDRERNVVWAVFAVDAYRDLMADWELHAKSLVARFRASFAKLVDDPWMASLVSDLQGRSPEFDQWWRMHEIQANSEKYKRLVMPDGTVLDFEINNFTVSDGSGLHMIVHSPKPGTPTRRTLQALLPDQ
jgi:hypothetical protein